ncbi:MAG: hypothetical protein LUD51_06490 [Clostridia bacterium]|nr:hypothetical protein [Clostridia bacterium]
MFKQDLLRTAAGFVFIMTEIVQAALALKWQNFCNCLQLSLKRDFAKARTVVRTFTNYRSYFTTVILYRGKVSGLICSRMAVPGVWMERENYILVTFTEKMT